LMLPALRFDAKRRPIHPYIGRLVGINEENACLQIMLRRDYYCQYF
jgi:hypothetical protein